MDFYKLVYQYLRHCNIKISKSFLCKRMESHPDYPSLISFTDTLDEIGLPYSAILAEKDKYRELKYPLMAYINHAGSETFVIVRAAKYFEVNNNALFQEWNGITIIAEANSLINCKDHADWIMKERKQSNYQVLCSLILMTGFLYIVLSNYTFTGLALLFLSMCGIAICISIILHSMGKDNAITNKLCSSGFNNSCNKVLHSKVNTIWKGVSLGDIGLVYFSGLCIFLVLTTQLHLISNSYSLLIIPFTVSIFFSTLSLWFQWKVIKTWCKMCLIIVFILWFQFISLYASLYEYPLIKYNLLTIELYLISLIIPVVAWSFIKPLILNSERLFAKEIALLKWKRNPDIFLSLLYRQRRINRTPWEDDITFGNSNNLIDILVVCSPYCRPCARGHKILEELLHNYKTYITVTVRFLINSIDANDKNYIAVNHILAASNSSSEFNIRKDKHPVDDWFEWLDIDKFKFEYGLLKKENIHFSVMKHENWAKSIKITFTPTCFINGYQLPEQYLLDDLKLLMPQLIENITPSALVYNKAI